jgi:excisionase family DNA binding protein
MPARKAPIRHPVPPTPPRWADHKQAAKYLTVSERTLDTYVSDGKVVAYKTPGERKLLFDLNEIDEVLRRGRVVVPVVVSEAS